MRHGVARLMDHVTTGRPDDDSEVLLDTAYAPLPSLDRLSPRWVGPAGQLEDAGIQNTVTDWRYYPDLPLAPRAGPGVHTTNSMSNASGSAATPAIRFTRRCTADSPSLLRAGASTLPRRFGLSRCISKLSWQEAWNTAEYA